MDSLKSKKSKFSRFNNPPQKNSKDSTPPDPKKENDKNPIFKLALNKIFRNPSKKVESPQSTDSTPIPQSSPNSRSSPELEEIKHSELDFSIVYKKYPQEINNISHSVKFNSPKNIKPNDSSDKTMVENSSTKTCTNQPSYPESLSKVNSNQSLTMCPLDNNISSGPEVISYYPKSSKKSTNYKTSKPTNLPGLQVKNQNSKNIAESENSVVFLKKTSSEPIVNSDNKVYSLPTTPIVNSKSEEDFNVSQLKKSRSLHKHVLKNSPSTTINPINRDLNSKSRTTDSFDLLQADFPENSIYYSHRDNNIIHSGVTHQAKNLPSNVNDNTHNKKDKDTRFLNRSFTIQQIPKHERYKNTDVIMIKNADGDEQTIKTILGNNRKLSESILNKSSEKILSSPAEIKSQGSSELDKNNQDVYIYDPTTKTFIVNTPNNSETNRFDATASARNISSPSTKDLQNNVSTYINSAIVSENSSQNEDNFSTKNVPNSKESTPSSKHKKSTELDNKKSSNYSETLNVLEKIDTNLLVKEIKSEDKPNSPLNTRSSENKTKANSDTKLSMNMSSSREANKKANTMRFHAARELVDTEKSFSENLYTIKKVWMDPVFASANAPKPIIPYQAARVIFDDIDVLYSHSTRFYKDLLGELTFYDSSVKINQDLSNLNIGQHFRSSERNWHSFISYVENYGSAVQYLNQLAEYKPFVKYQETTISQKRTGRQSLKDLLMLPIQRVMRYSLLIKNLLRHTPVNCNDHIELCRAIKLVNQLASVVNEARRRQEEFQHTLEVYKTIDNCPVIPTTTDSKFIGEHILHELVSRLPTRILIFSDYLIVTRLSPNSKSLNHNNSNAHTISNSHSYNYGSNSGTNSSTAANASISTNTTSSQTGHGSTGNSLIYGTVSGITGTLGNNNSENREHWVFYSYAPLHQAEVQNADEKADTLVTVLALNRYKPPTNTRRRSMSVTSILNSKLSISDSNPHSARASNESTLKNNTSINDTESSCIDLDLKANFSKKILGKDIKENQQSKTLANNFSKLSMSSTLKTNKTDLNSSKNETQGSNNQQIDSAFNENKTDEDFTQGKYKDSVVSNYSLRSTTSGNAFDKPVNNPPVNFFAALDQTFIPPPPLRTHVLVLQHKNSELRRFFVKSLKEAKVNSLNKIEEPAPKSIFKKASFIKQSDGTNNLFRPMYSNIYNNGTNTKDQQSISANDMGSIKRSGSHHFKSMKDINEKYNTLFGILSEEGVSSQEERDEEIYSDEYESSGEYDSENSFES
ncbi:hypothetical protein BB559_006192 [Furculomyces boomerangus]|uniref:DH domain-containing protein n=1 Tax=Furculomyces boomerangus TaxID=61424 RepID=A0A2T9Y4B9_9FUNG|nr:hypothetical protein BB559_006192 [Furculomyces boomerangus]